MTEREKMLEELSEILRYATIADTLTKMIELLKQKENTLGKYKMISKPQEPPFPRNVKTWEKKYQENLQKVKKTHRTMKWACPILAEVILFYLYQFFPMAIEVEDIGPIDITFFALFILVPLIIFIILMCIHPPVAKPKYKKEERDKIQVYQLALQGYQANMAHYQKQVDEDRFRVEQERYTKIQYKELREKLKRDLTVFQNGIRTVFSQGSLYPTFQTVDAAVALYHYFASGQCDTLKEAYNVYGIESRMDKVIAKLDELQNSLHAISAQLGRIGYNQQLLLSDMEQSKNVLIGMQQQLGSIESATKATAVVSAIDAYYSGVVASELKYIREKCLSD